MAKKSIKSEAAVSALKALPYDEYLQTEHWQQVRKRTLKAAGRRCQLCNRNDLTLHVHHRTYDNKGAEKPRDTIALCEECHGKFHDIQPVGDPVEDSRDDSSEDDFETVDAAKLQNHLAFIGVPKLYLSASVSHLDWVPYDFNHAGLFVTGAAGVGKTYLACAMLAWMSEICYKNESLTNHKFTTVHRVLLTLKEVLKTNGNECEKDIFNEFLEPPILVLDDLGAEKKTDWTAQSIHILLSERINDCTPTIVTSNLTLGEIDVYDPRLASRLGGMTYFKLDGEDRRLKC